MNILKDLRERAGISQNQLAKWTGVSPSLIQKLEYGERSFNKVSLETIYKFAIVFQVPMEVFVEWDKIDLNPRYKAYYEDVMHDVRLCYDKHCKAKIVKYTPKDDSEAEYEYLDWEMPDGW